MSGWRPTREQWAHACIVTVLCGASLFIATSSVWFAQYFVENDRFPHVRTLNIGGGLGVPDSVYDADLDLDAIDRGLHRFKEANPRLSLWLEPGRYIVARAGVLLTRVTQTKGKAGMRYVGVDTGMNSLIRPALYGARHPVVNLTR